MSAPVEPIVSQPLPLDTIICGDNCEVMRTLPSESIDLVVTSPPYDNLRTYSAGKSMSKLWDFEGVAQQLWRVIKPGGVVVWVVADATVNGSETGTSFRQALRFMEIGFRLETMVWDKGACGGAVGSNDWYYQSWEYMFCLAKGRPKSVNRLKDRPNRYAGKFASGTKRKTDGSLIVEGKGFHVEELGLRRNVWEIPVGSFSAFGNGHPAPFPEALARDHILSWSNKGDTILDPFCGSGTTCKMAIETCRHFIGIEIHEPYCRDIIVPRITNADPGFGFNG